MTIEKFAIILTVSLFLTSCGIHNEQRFKKSKLSNFTHDQTFEILEQLASEDISQLNVKVARLNAKLEELESGLELRDANNCCDTLSGQITALRSDNSKSENFEDANTMIVFFDLNKFKLEVSDKQELFLFKSRIDMAKEFCSDYKIKIYPYTDSTGNNDYNLRLRKLRGESIKKCFIDEFGVDENQVSVITKKFDHLPLDIYNRRALIEVDCL